MTCTAAVSKRYDIGFASIGPKTAVIRRQEMLESGCGVLLPVRVSLAHFSLLSTADQLW
jgi:hypothetical protein